MTDVICRRLHNNLHLFSICLLSTKLIRVNRQLLPFSDDVERHHDAADEQLPRRRDLSGLARRLPARQLARPERAERAKRARHLRRARIRPGGEPAAQWHSNGDEQGKLNYSLVCLIMHTKLKKVQLSLYFLKCLCSKHKLLHYTRTVDSCTRHNHCPVQFLLIKHIINCNNVFIKEYFLVITISLRFLFNLLLWQHIETKLFC
jgi:hypothetical protein